MKMLLPELREQDKLDSFRNNFYNIFEDPEKARKAADPLNLIFPIRRTFMTQKFGVEIELDDVSVSDAAQLVSEFFSNYGNHISGGWHVTDFQNRDWQIVYDGSVENGFEIVSPPLMFGDIHIVKQLLSHLDKIGAKEKDFTGVHIHVDVNDWNAQQLIALLNIYANHSSEIAKALNIVALRRSKYCRSIAWFAKSMKDKEANIEELKTAWYVEFTKGNKKMLIPESDDSKKHQTRYHEVNFHRYFETINNSESNTLEFRGFNSTKDPKTLQAYILFILTGVSFAKHLPDRPKLDEDLSLIDEERFFDRLKDMMTRYVLIEDDLYNEVELCFRNQFKTAS